MYWIKDSKNSKIDNSRHACIVPMKYICTPSDIFLLSFGAHKINNNNLNLNISVKESLSDNFDQLLVYQ